MADEPVLVATPPATTDPPATSRDAGRASARDWGAVFAVSLGIFTLMTSEPLPIGLLTPVSSGLGVSVGTAGLMMTAPGLVAAVFAPVVTVA